MNLKTGKTLRWSRHLWIRFISRLSISFHDQSDRISVFQLNIFTMDGFHFVFSQKIESLMKTVKTLMIATYFAKILTTHLMYVPDFVAWDQQSRRSAYVPHILISAFVFKHFVGTDGHWSGPNLSANIISRRQREIVAKTAWCPRSKLPLSDHVLLLF